DDATSGAPVTTSAETAAADRATTPSTGNDSNASSDDAGGPDAELVMPVGATGTVDVCTLFTEADAEAAVGGADLELALEQLADSCTLSAVDPLVMAFTVVRYQTDALGELGIEDIAAMTL